MNIVNNIVLITLLTFVGLVQASSPMVDTEWLSKHKNDAGIVLVDMSGDATQYQRFHIPGAVYLGYGNIVERRKKDKVSLRIADEKLYKILGILGISRDSHVVIYDDMGGLHAGRLFWQLERIGHPKVSIVDGGLVKWILEGRKVDNKRVIRKPVVYKPGDKIHDNEIDHVAVKQALEADSHTFLDVRTKEEYIGNPKVKRSGHLPGAQLWPWDASLDLGKGFVLKSDQQLLQSLAKVGVKDKTQPVVLYCNSAHRASQSYMTLRHLGFTNVKLYDGSVSEYYKDKSAPLTLGPKP